MNKKNLAEEQKMDTNGLVRLDKTIEQINDTVNTEIRESLIKQSKEELVALKKEIIHSRKHTERLQKRYDKLVERIASNNITEEELLDGSLWE